MRTTALSILLFLLAMVATSLLLHFLRASSAVPATGIPHREVRSKSDETPSPKAPRRETESLPSPVQSSDQMLADAWQTYGETINRIDQELAQ